MEQNIYKQKGFSNREQYLLSLSKEFKLSINFVKSIANIYGEREDFDGLVSALTIYADDEKEELVQLCIVDFYQPKVFQMNDSVFGIPIPFSCN